MSTLDEDDFSLGLNDPPSPLAEDDLEEPSAPPLPAPAAQAQGDSAGPPPPPLPATEEERLAAFLGNLDNYIDGQEWLDGLAGQGIELTDEEKTLWQNQPKKRKRNHITVGGFHHKGIYGLCTKLTEKYIATGLLKIPGGSKGSRGDQVHPIGKALMKLRRHMNRADASSVTDPEFVRLINLEKNRGTNEFYYVSQRDFLQEVFRRYGIKDDMEGGEKGEKFHPDDIIRLFGLLLTNEDIKDYVPDLMNESKSGTRQEIDAAPGRIRAAYRILSEYMSDPERFVPLPPTWNDEETRDKINDNSATGVFEQFGASLNPNNTERMQKKNWSESACKVRPCLL